MVTIIGVLKFISMILVFFLTLVLLVIKQINFFFSTKLVILMVCSGGCDFGDTSDNVRTRDISFMTILCVFAQATYSNKSPAQGDFFAAGKS